MGMFVGDNGGNDGFYYPEEDRSRKCSLYDLRSVDDIIMIDGKKYSVNQLKEIIEKAWQYDQLNK